MATNTGYSQQELAYFDVTLLPVVAQPLVAAYNLPELSDDQILVRLSLSTPSRSTSHLLTMGSGMLRQPTELA